MVDRGGRFYQDVAAYGQIDLSARSWFLNSIGLCDNSGDAFSRCEKHILRLF
jgi:hypothetical protein